MKKGKRISSIRGITSRKRIFSIGEICTKVGAEVEVGVGKRKIGKAEVKAEVISTKSIESSY